LYIGGWSQSLELSVGAMLEYIICFAHFVNVGGRILQLYPNPKETTYVAPTFPSLSRDVDDKYSNVDDR
jgi:hypothetical protein